MYGVLTDGAGVCFSDGRILLGWGGHGGDEAAPGLELRRSIGRVSKQ